MLVVDIPLFEIVLIVLTRAFGMHLCFGEEPYSLVSFVKYERHLPDHI